MSCLCSRRPSWHCTHIQPWYGTSGEGHHSRTLEHRLLCGCSLAAAASGLVPLVSVVQSPSSMSDHSRCGLVSSENALISTPLFQPQTFTPPRDNTPTEHFDTKRLTLGRFLVSFWSMSIRNRPKNRPKTDSNLTTLKILTGRLPLRGGEGFVADMKVSALIFFRNEKAAQRVSFGAGYPADVHADIPADIRGQKLRSGPRNP